MAAYDDEYRELIEEARDAVCRLLDESEHDAWRALRVGYGSLRDALARDDERRRGVVALVEKHTREDERARSREIEAEWKRAPMERREALLLDVLGEERLTVSQVQDRLDNEVAAGFRLTRRDGSRYTPPITNARSLVRKLMATGQLERAAETFKGKVRYRYFRRQGLVGPIAELERAYRAEPHGSE